MDKITNPKTIRKRALINRLAEEWEVSHAVAINKYNHLSKRVQKNISHKYNKIMESENGS